MAPIGPVCCRDSTPIFTFSNAVKALNSRLVWNVRAMPSLIHAVRLAPDDGLVRPIGGLEVIDPFCGVYTPVRQLKSDVLPAPFGPMTERISLAALVERDVRTGW